MAIEMVLTAIAEDRPGLVEALAEVIADNDGNWIDSEMARLGGEFAGILRISVPEANIEDLKTGFKGLSEQGIAITVRRDVAPPMVIGGRHAQIGLTGQDHSGIVLEATRVLSEHNVNVDHLHTAVFKGSMTGEPMFSAQMEVVLPGDLDIDTLRDAMEDIAHDLMVEIDLDEVEAA